MIVVMLLFGIFGGASCAAFAALAGAGWLMILMAYVLGGLMGMFLIGTTAHLISIQVQRARFQHPAQMRSGAINTTRI